MTIWYNEYKISYFLAEFLRLPRLNCSVLNPPRFDANPDPNFHVIADTDPDPDPDSGYLGPACLALNDLGLRL
jgi:hypothetical protein